MSFWVFTAAAPRILPTWSSPAWSRGCPQVLTIHAEMEGGPFLGEFARLLSRCRERRVEFFRLEDWARELLRNPDILPVAQVNSQRLPGRAGYVSCQGPQEARSS